MKATTRIKSKLAKIDETISKTNDLLVDATIEKVVVSERAWLDTFGSYDAANGKIVAKRRMELSGLPVEFGEVNEAEIVVSLEVDAAPVEEPDLDPIKRSAKASKRK
jgi:hypothetical protein